MTASHARAPEPGGDRRVATRFGEFSVDPGSEVTFPLGLPGFEHCHRFVLLSSGDLAPFSVLHAVDAAAASFLVIDPRRVLGDYRCELGPADLARLGAAGDTVLLWLAIVSLGEDGWACANLRAPIVIHPGRMIGYQLMPHNSLYPLRHPLDVG